MSNRAFSLHPVGMTGDSPHEPSFSRHSMGDGRPSVLLVEYRDEVFARVASDLFAAGVRVEWARSGWQASRRFFRRRPDLLVAHVDLPDESGWLLAAKLRLICHRIRTWIYTPWFSQVEVALADFIGAEELIDYGGDLWRLSDAIVERVTQADFGESPGIGSPPACESEPVCH